MEIVSLNQISPDQVIIWSWGFVTLNVTILYTWLVMAILLFISWLATRNLSSEMNVSRWQHFLEVVISVVRGEISEMTKKARIITFLLSGLSFCLSVLATCWLLCRDLSRRRLPLPPRLLWRCAYSLLFLITAFRATVFSII